MGICASKRQAKSVTAAKPVEASPVKEKKLEVAEEQKQEANPHRQKYVRSRKKPSPKMTEGTEEHEAIPLLGHHLFLTSAQSPQSQSGFEDKPLTLVSNDFSLDLLTRTGIGYACKKGLKPESPNQDDFCILMESDIVILGVFDGHGPCGHLMAEFVRSELPKSIAADERLKTQPLEVLKSSFLLTNERLKSFCSESGGLADCSLSGTTASVVLFLGTKVFTAHVGDSRIVMGRKNGEEYQAVALTVDHKPTLPGEQQRIESCGGEVRKLPYDIPYRVFIKGTEDPGLSMSRSIGDTISQSIGVICEPEVSEVAAGDGGEFILICSDGVWEFIKDEEAVNLIGKFSKGTAKQGAEKLAQLAWMRWLHNEGEVVDDITVVATFT